MRDAAAMEKVRNISLNTTAETPVNPAELADLGEGQVAFVRPMLSQDVAKFFPQAPEIEPGLQLFALLSASCAPIMLTDSRDAAVANAWAHDLETVSLH